MRLVSLPFIFIFIFIFFFLDPSLRHRLFVASMVAIERHDTRLVESLQNPLGRPPPDQPYFLDVNVSGLVRETPLGDDSARVP